KSVPERIGTTTPTQSLLLINGEQTLGRAKALSRRLIGAGHRTSADLTDDAFRRAWSRSPSSDELADALTFLETTSDAIPSVLQQERLDDFCHVLLNANQFLYVD
ncbi:MAG: DUF1553 domain-containing protein, partial [Planctomycetaceae bacterium]